MRHATFGLTKQINLIMKNGDRKKCGTVLRICQTFANSGAALKIIVSKQAKVVVVSGVTEVPQRIALNFSTRLCATLADSIFTSSF